MSANQPKRRLPASYKDATLRCTTPLRDFGHMGIAFDLQSGDSVRLRIGESTAKDIVSLIKAELSSSHQFHPEEQE